MQCVENHFVAVDGKGKDIGVVKWIESGPDKGWLWSMTRVHPGKPFLDRGGMEETRVRRRWRSSRAGGRSGNGTGSRAD